MKRLLPAPLMSAFLAAMWLLLEQSLAPGQLVLAAVLGLAVPRVTRRLRPLLPRPRRPWVIARLVGTVLGDIVQSAIHVCAVILGGSARRRKSGFVDIPLDLRDVHGLAALSAIINSTPGTVWADLSDDRKVLTIHVLDLDGEQRQIDTIKSRYEKPLMAIFDSTTPP